MMTDTYHDRCIVFCFYQSSCKPTKRQIALWRLRIWFSFFLSLSIYLFIYLYSVKDDLLVALYSYIHPIVILVSGQVLPCHAIHPITGHKLKVVVTKEEELFLDRDTMLGGFTLFFYFLSTNLYDVWTLNSLIWVV